MHSGNELPLLPLMHSGISMRLYLIPTFNDWNFNGYHLYSWTFSDAASQEWHCWHNTASTADTVDVDVILQLLLTLLTWHCFYCWHYWCWHDTAATANTGSTTLPLLLTLVTWHCRYCWHCWHDKRLIFCFIVRKLGEFFLYYIKKSICKKYICKKRLKKLYFNIYIYICIKNIILLF